MNTATVRSEGKGPQPSHWHLNQFSTKAKWILAISHCVILAIAAALFYSNLFAQTQTAPAENVVGQFRSHGAEICPLRSPKDTSGINVTVELRRIQGRERRSRALAVSATLNDELHEHWMVYGLDVFADNETKDRPSAFLKLSNDLPEVAQRRSVQFEIFKLDAEADHRLVFLLLPRGHQRDIDGAIRKLKNGGLTVEFSDLDRSPWAFSESP